MSGQEAVLTGDKFSKFSNCSWELLKSDGGTKNWLAKFAFENSSYHLALSDTSSIYLESLNGDEIAGRCKEMNKRLEAPNESIVNHLKQSLSYHHKFNYTSDLVDNGVVLSLSNQLNCLPFNWKFKCEINLHESSTKLLFCNPMILSISRLLLENAKLKEIVKQKDTEIQDYKDGGSKISRPHLETTSFDAVTFESDMKHTKEYAVAITKQPIKIAAGRAFNDLLISTMTDQTSDEVVALLLQNDSKDFRIAGNHTSTSQSPYKIRTKRRKPQPTFRGCVLNVSDDETLPETSAEVQLDDKEKTNTTIVKPISKKQKTSRKSKKSLF